MINSAKLIAFLFLFQVGCKSSTTSAENKAKLPAISKITLEAITRGYRENIEISAKQIYFKGNKPGNSEMKNKTSEITNAQWKSILKKVAELDLDQLAKLEAPTNARLYDGDLASTITIYIEDEKFTSSSFDKKNPPSELKALVGEIYNLVK